MANKKQKWIFTFGLGQENEGHYIEIYGTFEEARTKMVERYHDNWGFQYSEKEWQEWLRKKPVYLPAETLLETIP